MEQFDFQVEYWERWFHYVEIMSAAFRLHPRMMPGRDCSLDRVPPLLAIELMISIYEEENCSKQVNKK